ncbi:MAG TPA: GerMN domain-containing protein [Lachnospiraceae bacterium]|nr:GerMN domain-containing protein [Lachnospiraceae bacterium]
MKRIYLAVLMIMITLLIGCSEQNGETVESDYYAYYINKDETKVVPQPYVPEGTSTEDLIIEFLAILETDPANTELKKPIDAKVNLLDYYLEEGQLVIDFSENYSEADSVKEVLCRAAIVRTLVQIDGVDGVSFRVNGEPLLDSNEQPISVMTAESFIDNTGTEINSYEKTNLHLYFANETGDGLISTVQPVAYSSNISMEKLVTEHIIAGTESRGTYPTVSPDTKILGITVKDGICYLNLSEDFLTVVYPVTEDVILYSLVNSLTELPNVNKVQISIDGNTERYFGDHINLESLYERNLELLNPQETVR